MPSSRVAILIRRRTALNLAWTLGLLLAAGAGWGVARLVPADAWTSRDGESAAVARTRPAEPERPVLASNADARPLGPPLEPVSSTPPPPSPPQAEAKPSPVPPKTERRRKPAPPVEPEPAVASYEPPAAEPPPEPAEPPASQLLASAVRADRLAEQGDAERAKQEAAALLAHKPSYSELIATLVAAGADEVRARLTALRVLQLAGLESISREVARELKRSYAGSGEITESIRRWGILTPRITSLESTIEEGWVTVSGKLENPDIGDIRRVRIQVEALDAGGNLLGTAEARVRPKVLSPGGSGAFSASFKKLDPAAVLRTRATVVEWEGEVPNAG